MRKNGGNGAADTEFLYGGFYDGVVRYWKRGGKRPKSLTVGTSGAHVALAGDHLVTASRTPAHIVVWKRTAKGFVEVRRWDTPAVAYGTRMAAWVFGEHLVWHNDKVVLVFEWGTGATRARFDIAVQGRERVEVVCLDGADLFVGVGDEVRTVKL